MAGNTYVKIATYTVGATSYTFTNIPQTCTDLVLRFSWRETGTTAPLGSFAMQINGDTGANYRQSYMYSNQASVLGFSQTSQNYIIPVAAGSGPGANANSFGNVEIYFPNYTNNWQYKSFSIEGTTANNSSTTDYNRSMVGTGTWTPGTQAPITSIYVQGNAAVPATYSEVTLYGVRNY